MLKKLLGAAAMAASAYAFVPAHAAHLNVGCGTDELARTEGALETMADGPGKFTAEREVAEAQDAMFKGSMRGSAMHLSRAMHAESLAQAPYGNTPYASTPYGSTSYGSTPYGGTMAQAPAETLHKPRPNRNGDGSRCRLRSRP
jgi:hypothetical protein